MKLFKLILSGVILLALILTLNTKFGSVPPLGKFFDPDAGFWANAETGLPESESLELPGLHEQVSVYFDDRRVPHIFAQNEHDLFMAQGFITAQQRLFQMEIQTYDAAGRLSEIIGENERVQNRDLTTRRWGMPWAAEKKVEVVKQDPESWAILTAYADGVNAYIASLSESEYPVEYKVLDIAPEPWTPLKTSQLHMNMARTLAGGSSDDRTSNTLAYFGEEFIDTFFKTKPEMLEPIIPPSRTWDFNAEQPEAPEKTFIPKTAERIQFFEPDAGVGSNNWAVHGSKTKSGNPILAGDPHLQLTMPSIWMEQQLHAPGYNAYGVGFQGIPGILIGFNEHIAWSETNTGSDVMDWYEIRFKDSSKNEYWYDDEWHPTTKRVEEIAVRDGEPIIDTLVFTHHGPVMLANPEDTVNPPVYHAMRWIAHEAGNSLKTFIKLNKAKNYDEYVDALKHYVAPAQNFVFASNEGDVAIWVNGKFPNKWDYQGQKVSDGTDPAYDWQGWIPQEQNPSVKNPPRGFVSSANQESTDDSYPYYLSDDFAPYERGTRINKLLRNMDDITPQDMMKMQMDDFSMLAESILPDLIYWTDTEQLTDKELEILDAMKGWDYHMDADEFQPSMSYRWWVMFYSSVVDDEYDAAPEALRYPSRDRMIEVIKADPAFFMVDNINTEQKETVSDLATQSFKDAVEYMMDRYGDQDESWKWGWVMNNDINHVGQIPGFGAMDVYSSGSYEAINATRFGYGPSWRMVVELGPEVKGWGVYPGGISGNPGSPNYDAFVENWRTGQHFELNFYREKPENSLYEIMLKGN